MGLSSLDFLWKLLIVVSLSSTFLFGAFVAVQSVIKNISGTYLKAWSRWSVMSFLGTVALFSVLLAGLDQGLQLNCFGNFAHSQGIMGMTRILAIVWLGGACVLLAKDIFHYRRMKSALKDQVVSTTADYVVTVTGDAMTYGILTPQVLIPKAVAGNSDLLRDVLAHEKTHARNKDGFWSLLEIISLRLCWFNPLSFVFHYRFQLVMEMATDEQAVRDFSLDPKVYAQSLLTMLEMNQTHVNSFAALRASFDYKQMRARLLNLQSQQGLQSQRGRRGVLALVMIVMGVMGFGQAWASVQMQKSQNPHELICMQVQHELVIEKLLLAQPETNKCE